MAILTRPKLSPNQRFDLEDYNLELSALRTDSHFYTGSFLAATSYILQGFTISNSAVGQATATISLTNATLINPNNTGDVSWWVASPSIPTLTLPIGVGGLLPGRNYVELTISAVDGTPLQRAFWDPSANSGAGVEFTQDVNTVTELYVNAQVNQTSFTSGNPNLMPLAIIDVSASTSLITGIRDKRNLLFRLATNDNINNQFPWASQQEPSTVFTLSPVGSTAFLAGESITIGDPTTTTASVLVGGTSTIQVFNFSNDTFVVGSLVTGETSGATGILANYYENFTGADKDIHTYKDMFSALQTEIQRLKGTPFWYQVGPTVSLMSLLNYVNTIKAPLTNGARFSWTGSSFLVTDNATSGQTSADALAALRIPGQGSNIYLSRQDGTGGSAALAIPNQNVLFVQLPALGSGRSYSGSGSGATNYQVLPIAQFQPSDSNFILAYREGNQLVIPGMGELKPGESIDVSGETSIELLAYIGAADETSTNPQYTTLPSTNLSNQFTTSDSLTQAISINAANINDIVAAILSPYEETITVISGSPSDAHEVTGPISSGTDLTLPLDTRHSSAVKKYLVGLGSLQIFLNGIQQVVGVDYAEVGSSGSLSNQIQILTNLVVGDQLDVRIMTPQFFGTVGQDQPYFVNLITGQNGSTVPTGALYNVGTGRLQVFRDGLNMVLSNTVGSAIDQYGEETTNSLSLNQAANPSEVFTMVNFPSPNPTVQLQTGITGTVITVPTYTTGSGLLKIFRNGLLMSNGSGASADLAYVETSSTQLTLSLAAQTTDAFRVVIFPSGSFSWQGTVTGQTGTTITTPNSFTNGSSQLLVFKNGLLMTNSTVIDQPANQYQQSGTNAIVLQVAAITSDFFDFIYV